MGKKAKKKKVVKKGAPVKKEPKPVIKYSESNFCLECGYPIAPGNKYCGECLCEDDCGY